MEEFIKNLESQLVGKSIKCIRYMNEREMEMFGWYKRPVIILLNDDTFIIPQSDDEGNDGGAIALIKGKKFNLIPTT
jgi:hypothetical protein